MTEEISSIVPRLRAIARQEEPGDTAEVLDLIAELLPHIRDEALLVELTKLLNFFVRLFSYRDYGVRDAFFEHRIRDVLEQVDLIEATFRLN
ncbi:hypothetical protein [Pseudaminobacter soli (ex Li et al. 2025)]|uniref:Uncharacterized protein n=1 Tax=Pseudaminobacter soli (ex Li et al. 2025) TaxID=1295366 RepID=A0A2P7RTX6_9HYPH|nr:hypothetical protein [Mesorhizobium soli]PSJ53656.1 hypothetical protein C7I85_27935 [Mesorhizobium soli]